MKQKILIAMLMVKWFVAIPLGLAVMAILFWHGSRTGHWIPQSSEWAALFRSVPGWFCAALAVWFFAFIGIARRSTAWRERCDAAVVVGDLKRAAECLRHHRRWKAFVVWLPFHRDRDLSIAEKLGEISLNHGLYKQAIELYAGQLDMPFPDNQWIWPFARWHNYACALARGGHDSEAIPWLEKEEALVAAHPETDYAHYMALVTRGFLALHAKDFTGLERITDELTQPQLPAKAQACRVIGHMLRSDLEVLRGNSTEALRHARLFLTLRESKSELKDDLERMQAREEELSTALRLNKRDPEADWAGTVPPQSH